MIISHELSKSVIDIFHIAMKCGKPIIFPTDTIYGIGAFTDNISANKLIYSIKKRSIDKPFPLLISSVDMLKDYAIDINKRTVEYLLNDTPTTVIINVNSKLDNIYCKNGTAAFRIPKKRWLADIIKNHGHPLTATSVNKSGDEFINNFKLLVESYSEQVDYFIDGDVSLCSSKIFDLSKDKVVELR